MELTSNPMATDDQVWDFTESVKLESVGKGSPTVCRVQRAKRRAVTARDQAASGGVYVASDVNWHLPARFVEGITPKPGDVVEEDGGDRWTALEVAYNRVRCTWKLTSRNLSLAHALADTVTVERATVEYDAAGVAVKRFPTGDGPLGGRVLYTVKARVQPDVEEVSEARGVRGQVERFVVIVEKQLYDLDPAEDRIRWVDRGVVKYLDIDRYEEAERLGSLPQIRARWEP